jgi:hypothetical protein
MLPVSSSASVTPVKRPRTPSGGGGDGISGLDRKHTGTTEALKKEPTLYVGWNLATRNALAIEFLNQLVLTGATFGVIREFPYQYLAEALSGEDYEYYLAMFAASLCTAPVLGLASGVFNHGLKYVEQSLNEKGKMTFRGIDADREHQLAYRSVVRASVFVCAGLLKGYAIGDQYDATPGSRTGFAALIGGLTALTAPLVWTAGNQIYCRLKGSEPGGRLQLVKPVFNEDEFRIESLAKTAAAYPASLTAWAWKSYGPKPEPTIALLLAVWFIVSEGLKAWTKGQLPCQEARRTAPRSTVTTPAKKALPGNPNGSPSSLLSSAAGIGDSPFLQPRSAGSSPASTLSTTDNTPEAVGHEHPTGEDSGDDDPKQVRIHLSSNHHTGLTTLPAGRAQSSA